MASQPYFSVLQLRSAGVRHRFSARHVAKWVRARPPRLTCGSGASTGCAQPTNSRPANRFLRNGMFPVGPERSILARTASAFRHSVLTQRTDLWDNCADIATEERFMPSTGISGITVDAAGHRIIDKEYRGVRIYVRLGPISEEEAEQRLDAELNRVEADLERGANFRPRFADCAARYLVESKYKRSVGVVAWHVRLLGPYLGTLEVNRVHDRTLNSTT